MRSLIGKLSVLIFLLVVTGVAGAGIPAAWAASPEFTASQQAAFDLTVSAADEAFASQLKRQHEEFRILKQSGRDWEQKIADLHYRSEENLVVLRKKIKQIDADKVAQLKQSAEQTKARYKKLFDLYRSVNLQLDAARKIKNKTIIAMLRTQADGLKIPVQLAREDIRRKDAAYHTARTAALAKMKKLRDMLSPIAPVQVQIKAAKGALGAPKDSQWTVWKSFTHALTKRDAKTATGLLGSANSLSGQIVERLQKIHGLESRIADIIRSTENQLAQSG